MSCVAAALLRLRPHQSGGIISVALVGALGGATMLYFCVGLAACSGVHEPSDPDRETVHLFDEAIGLGVSVSPPAIVPDGNNAISVSATPAFSGTGHFVVECPSGYGELVSPVESDLGRASVEVRWVARQARQLTWIVQFYDTPNPTYVGLVASMDSLDLSIGRVSVYDPRAAAILGRVSGTELFRRIAIER
jgi:hypothetical protein